MLIHEVNRSVIRTALHTVLRHVLRHVFRYMLQHIICIVILNQSSQSIDACLHLRYKSFGFD